MGLSNQHRPVILTDLINEVVRHLGDGERERQGKALINSVQELVRTYALLLKRKMSC